MLNFDLQATRQLHVAQQNTMLAAWYRLGFERVYFWRTNDENVKYDQTKGRRRFDADDVIYNMNI